jgi:hypothetical protein
MAKPVLNNTPCLGNPSQHHQESNQTRRTITTTNIDMLYSGQCGSLITLIFSAVAITELLERAVFYSTMACAILLW